MRVDWSFFETSLQGLLTGPCPHGGPPPHIHALSTDTRTLQPGDWFVPLRGENFDGHLFLAEAAQRGAAGFILDGKTTLTHSPSLPVISVVDTLLAYQAIAKGWRRSLHPTVIALTGSLGKTTTKEFTRGILSQKHPQVLAAKGNFNNEVGVPYTLLQLTPAHQYALLELGARHTGDIQALTELAQPDIAALISVESVHVDIFGSIEAIAKEKFEILAHSPAHTLWVANQDNPWIAASIAPFLGKRPIYTYGYHPQAEIRILRMEPQPDASAMVELRFPENQSLSLHLPSAHPGYLLNATAACAIAYAAKLPLADMQAGLGTFSSVPGRFCRVITRSLTVIDDTYNAHPSSMRAGLEAVTHLFPTEKKILVLGDMREIGADWQEQHQAIGALCAPLSGLEQLLVVGERGFYIGQGAITAGLSASRVHHFPTVQALLETKPIWGKSVVYAKASRAIGLDKLITYLKSET